ncbi:ATP-binding protein [Actinoplanes sp. NPDC026623]|uniref:ATP-binding protein n=1 Tax=Actinoplanes sp. NPDC026623 TaxID=3155610 RepID=UPI0033DAB12D
MEETVDHEVLGPAPGRESPDSAPARKDPDRSIPARSDRARFTLLDRTFGRDEITVVRHEVTARLNLGVLGDRLPGFVLAINEVITNAVLHAGGHGRIVLWGTAGSLWCTVTDSGPGIPERFRHPPQAPEAFEVGGRGIWLAHQLCDEVTMATGPIGTTIGLRIVVPHRITMSDLVNGASTGG